MKLSTKNHWGLSKYKNPMKELNIFQIIGYYLFGFRYCHGKRLLSAKKTKRFFDNLKKGKV